MTVYLDPCIGLKAEFDAMKLSGQWSQLLDQLQRTIWDSGCEGDWVEPPVRNPDATNANWAVKWPPLTDRSPYE